MTVLFGSGPWPPMGAHSVLMTCRHVAQLRDVYLDGELSSGLTAELHAHLLQCPECQQQFEMFRACNEVVQKDRPPVQLDSGFASRVVAALPRTHPLAEMSALPTRRDRRRRFWRLVASNAAPAAAAVLFFAVLIWPSGVPEGPNGRVEGASATAIDATAVKDVVSPALDAFKKTGRAADSFNTLSKIVADEARQGVEKSAENPVVEPNPESALLDVFLAPFRDVLHPIKIDGETEPENADIVRF